MRLETDLEKRRLVACYLPSAFSHVQLSFLLTPQCQRRQYKLLRDGKTSNMTPERISELQSIGFEFVLRDHKSSSGSNEGNNSNGRTWKAQYDNHGEGEQRVRTCHELVFFILLGIIFELRPVVFSFTVEQHAFVDILFGNLLAAMWLLIRIVNISRTGKRRSTLVKQRRMNSLLLRWKA